MDIRLKDNEFESITYITQPDAHLYPVEELSEEDRILKGFKWIEGKRPLKKEDIFIW